MRGCGCSYGNSRKVRSYQRFSGVGYHILVGCVRNLRDCPTGCDKCERWDLLHYGVDSVEPELSRCPPDTCISSFESHTLPNKKERHTPLFFIWCECSYRTFQKMLSYQRFFRFQSNKFPSFYSTILLQR